MNAQAISEIKTLLKTSKKIAIIPHYNPDGDALGSTLGLLHYLLKINHNASIISPNNSPDFLKWLPNHDTICNYETTPEACDTFIETSDIIFTLDFNALHRTGNMAAVLEKSNAIKIMIDHHHQPQDYATYMYSDVTMSSTCEMIYHFFDKLNVLDTIDKAIATCLYTGIMTDTGSFKYSATTNVTHTIIAHLIEKGADGTMIHNAVFDTNNYNRLQLLGRALQNLKVIPESKTAYITLSHNELNEFNYKKGDTEGFVNYGLSLKNVVLAAIFIEDKKQNIIKISLRSKGDFSVNELSRQHFSGGGHTNAAGGKSELSLKDTVKKFISILPSYNKALNEV